jgi:aromatic ring-cleaving dioxygenase
MSFAWASRKRIKVCSLSMGLRMEIKEVFSVQLQSKHPAALGPHNKTLNERKKRVKAIFCLCISCKMSIQDTEKSSVV